MDLNADGNKDLLAAGYAGICYIFYGTNEGKLKAPEVLKDKTGTDIHTGTYYDFVKNAYISVKEIKNGDKTDFVKAVDWDSDGDLDLLTSGANGIKLRLNEGNKRTHSFAKSSIHILDKYHADAIVDWDGDGLWDIIAGGKKGGVYFYKNTGNKNTPKFNDPVCLVKKEELADIKNGGRCGLCQPTVTDYNKDGKLDIVVGCMVGLPPKKLNLTADQIKERDSLKKLLAEEEKEMNAYRAENFTNKYDDGAEMKKAMKADKKWAAMITEFIDIRAKYEKLVPRGESKGKVFVCLRK